MNIVYRDDHVDTVPGSYSIDIELELNGQGDAVLFSDNGESTWGVYVRSSQQEIISNNSDLPFYDSFEQALDALMELL